MKAVNYRQTLFLAVVLAAALAGCGRIHADVGPQDMAAQPPSQTSVPF